MRMNANVTAEYPDTTIITSDMEGYITNACLFIQNHRRKVTKTIVLDAGASIMIPQIKSVAQGKDILALCKLGVNIGGTRSVPPARYIPSSSMVRPSHYESH